MKKYSLLILSLFLFGFTGELAEEIVDIQEWKVPWEGTRPRDPYVAPDGMVWFVGQTGNYIAYLNPKSGEFKRYEIEEGTHPHNLIVDKKGMVWYAGNRNARIGMLNPETGKAKIYPMPEAAARDPHTLVFTKEENIWFTLQGANMIGHLDTRSGKVRLANSKTERSRPYGIKLDSNDQPWIVLFGTNKIATVDPKTMMVKEFEIPRAEARPRRMEITSDDRVWYVDYRGGMLGVLEPKTGEFKEWMTPGGAGSRPYGTALDDKERIWFVEGGDRSNNKFVGFDTKTETFLVFVPIESGGGTVRHMYYHPPTREIWFGTDTNYIGRARVSK